MNESVFIHPLNMQVHIFFPKLLYCYIHPSIGNYVKKNLCPRSLKATSFGLKKKPYSMSQRSSLKLIDSLMVSNTVIKYRNNEACSINISMYKVYSKWCTDVSSNPNDLKQNITNYASDSSKQQLGNSIIINKICL